MLAGRCSRYVRKALHWREDLDANSILSGAKQMVDAAQSCGRILAVNTQYTAALEPFFAIYSRERGQLERIESFLFEMESKGSRRGANEYEDIWRELGPHALSLLLGALPYGKIDMSTLEAEMDRDYVNVRFRWVDGGAAPCDVTILTRCIREGQPKRRFGINGFVVDIGAVREEGVYKTVCGTAKAKCGGTTWFAFQFGGLSRLCAAKLSRW
jgi:hypothetical protein